MNNPDRFVRAGTAFTRLCRLMSTLRAPGGCAWDREQTLTTLKPYLLEEAYETLEAMESGDARAHCEELGDLLLQVVFQAEIAQESADFDAAAVADSICDKLTRRHPHVFGDIQAPTAPQALQAWESIKAEERKGQSKADKGRLDGIPRALPGLIRAFRTGEKAAAAGFDWPDRQGSMDKVLEEIAELQDAIKSGDPAAMQDEMGDALFALVNLCRHCHMDPETALAGTVEKFQRRFRHIETTLAERQQPLTSATLNELNSLWDEAKDMEDGVQPHRLPRTAS